MLLIVLIVYLYPKLEIKKYLKIVFVLGFIYEYLISMFAANAGKKAGE